MLEKQNLVFQHISDLCCYLLKASEVYSTVYINDGNPRYQNWALLPILQAFSVNVLNDVLDNLGILKERNF